MVLNNIEMLRKHELEHSIMGRIIGMFSEKHSVYSI